MLPYKFCIPADQVHVKKILPSLFLHLFFFLLIYTQYLQVYQVAADLGPDGIFYFISLFGVQEEDIVFSQ